MMHNGLRMSFNFSLLNEHVFSFISGFWLSSLSIIPTLIQLSLYESVVSWIWLKEDFLQEINNG